MRYIKYCYSSRTTYSLFLVYKLAKKSYFNKHKRKFKDHKTYAHV